MARDPQLSVLWLKFLRDELNEEELLELNQSLAKSRLGWLYIIRNSDHTRIKKHLQVVRARNDDQILCKIKRIQILESSGYHFRIEGRIINVLPD